MRDWLQRLARATIGQPIGWCIGSLIGWGLRRWMQNDPNGFAEWLFEMDRHRGPNATDVPDRRSRRGGRTPRRVQRKKAALLAAECVRLHGRPPLPDREFYCAKCTRLLPLNARAPLERNGQGHVLRRWCCADCRKQAVAAASARRAARLGEAAGSLNGGAG